MDRPGLAWAEVTIDCRDAERNAKFWSAVLGVTAESGSEGWFHLGPTVRGGPRLNIQPVPETKVGKARVHLDIWVDDLDAAIALVEELGGAHTGEVHAGPEGVDVVMTDPEGTEFCLVALPPT
jgi:predicted enzyme related to lactoylglutathione lyase